MYLSTLQLLFDFEHAMTQLYLNFLKFRKLAVCYTPPHFPVAISLLTNLVKYVFFKRKISSTIALYFEEIYRPWAAPPPLPSFTQSPATPTRKRPGTYLNSAMKDLV